MDHIVTPSIKRLSLILIRNSFWPYGPRSWAEMDHYDWAVAELAALTS